MSKADSPPTKTAPTNGRCDRPSKTQPTRVLPTNRLAVAKIIEIVRAYAASSEPDRHPVTNADVGKIVGLQGSTVALSNAFLVSAGFIERVEGGFVPSPDVVAFHRAYSWNPDTAAKKLAPIVGRAWFCAALMPKLRFRPMEENEAIADLAEAAGAGTDYRVQLEMLLDYMELTNIITRDGIILRLAAPDAGDSNTQANDSIPCERNTQEPQPSLSPQDALSTTFAKSGGGGVRFNINVEVDMREVSAWRPDRIEALFKGIAAVLAAKGATEVKEGTP
jgi:hypothetical protein